MFPGQVEAVLLAGGGLEKLQWHGEKPASKGFLPVAGLPLAAWTLRGLVESPRVGRIILVAPTAPAGEGWEGVDQTVPAGEKLMDSFCQGVEAAQNPEQPMLICCGDLPLLTGRAVTDFIERCGNRPEASIWYGFLRRENSEKVFPTTRHTWAKFADGTFCGTGMMMLRPQVVGPVRQAMESLTRARKNMPYLASRMGWGTVFAYLLGRLTVAGAEAAGKRIFGVICAGVESPYAESGFNVDDDLTLREACERLTREGGPKP